MTRWRTYWGGEKADGRSPEQRSTTQVYECPISEHIILCPHLAANNTAQSIANTDDTWYGTGLGVENN